MIHCTASYEQGRAITANFCPAAVGINNPRWYVAVNTIQELTFQGERHKTVTINDFGKLRFGLESIYGQL